MNRPTILQKLFFNPASGTCVTGVCISDSSGLERMLCASDVTDNQWRLIASSIPPPKPGARPRSNNLREVVNAILYLSRTGCSWRQLPHDFPPQYVKGS